LTVVWGETGVEPLGRYCHNQEKKEKLPLFCMRLKA